MRRVSVAVLLLALSFAEPAIAGKFRVVAATVERSDSGQGTLVAVEGEARYSGKPKRSETDVFYLWTFLNRDQDGSDDLDRIVTWTYNEPLPDVLGEKVIRFRWDTSTDPPVDVLQIKGYSIYCPTAEGSFCSAADTVPYCASNSSSGVRYRGAVGIYRGSGTVIGVNRLEHSRLTEVGETTCGRTVGGVVENLEKDQSVTIEGTFARPGEEPVVRSVTVSHAKGKYTGEFEFPEKVKAYSNYEIAVTSQPTNGQRCSLHPATSDGSLGKDDVRDIRVVCSRTCHAGKTIARPAGEYLLIDEADRNADPPILPTVGNCVPDADPQDCTVPELIRDGFVVLDIANNLLWTWDYQRPPFAVVDYYSKNEAESICSTLELGGRDDWHLPDIEQLRTLLPVCEGVLANCQAGELQYYGGDVYLHRPAGYWSTTKYFQPPECNYNHICSCGTWGEACSWVALFSEEDTFGMCDEGHTGAGTNRTNALVRCVTDLVP